MRIGVVFPQTEIGADPIAIRDYVQAAVDLGFVHLLAYDHVVGADVSIRPNWAGPYTSATMFHEPFVLFGYIAALAPSLELVPGVIILPQRQATLVAKQAAEIDVLTGGKFRLGVGIGWNDVEYEALGMNFHNRGRRFEEQIALIRALHTREVISFEGRHHRVTAAGLNPMPIQRPIPIWIGGSVEAALKRAAEIADGFFPQRPLEGGWPATIERMRGWATAAGRDFTKLGIESRVNGGGGTPDDWRKSYDEWRALGATHVSVNTMGGGLRSTSDHIARLRAVKATLG
ncbi:MAG: LLM class F420-dependent oxidoreductase [Chloroflexota bacterium]|nr:MAG: LLM class F420-dependent oxidoreductase [Chloroflexota bacterium]